MENSSPTNNNPPPEKPRSYDARIFTKRKFESSTPAGESFLDDFKGIHIRTSKEYEKSKEASKSMLGKKKQGLSRSEFRTVLKKMPYDKTGLHEKERVGLEKEMDQKTYGENIDIKDVQKHIKNLKKEESLAPLIKERVEASHKRALLEKLKGKKK